MAAAEMFGRGGGLGRGRGGFGRGRGGGGGGGGPSPALLTSYIKKAFTLQALFETCSQHCERFNHIHLSACWNTLGHLTRATEQPQEAQAWAQQHSAALHLLLKRTSKVVSSSSEVRARELANIAHGVAKSGVCSGGGEEAVALMGAVAVTAQPLVVHCNAQELANLAWAFAKAQQQTPALFNAIADQAMLHLKSFKPQEVSNLVWAYATARHEAPQLFQRLAHAVVPLEPCRLQPG